MKKIVRYSTFETNSSSTHCFVCLNDKAYKKFAYKGYYLQLPGEWDPEFVDASDNLIKPEKIPDKIKELKQELLKDEWFVSADKEGRVLDTDILLDANIIAAHAEEDREAWPGFEYWEAEHMENGNWELSVEWNDFHRSW